MGGEGGGTQSQTNQQINAPLLNHTVKYCRAANVSTYVDRLPLLKDRR